LRQVVIEEREIRLINHHFVCCRKGMKQYYLELNNRNRKLLQEYKIRSQNHKDLVDALKQINVIIQKAANLRGKQHLKVVN